MRQNTITANEMKAIDMNAAGLGMSPLQLMENAGGAVAEIAANVVSSIRTDTVTSNSLSHSSSKNGSPSVLFLAGLGNNGGDTFVAARHLACSGISSAVLLLGPENQIKTEESRANFKLLKQTSFISVFEIKSESDLAEIYQNVGKNATVIVDGIFGTGFSGTPKGVERTAIELMNNEREKRNDLFVLAVDIPSGMPPSDFSEIDVEKNTRSQNLIVKADATVTFHKMKTWLEGNAAGNVGRIYIRSIGIPENAEKYVGPGDLSLLYRRTAESKKGDSGKVLVIAGGPYSGAPALAGAGALRTGCDIVTVAVPTCIYLPIASFTPEFIVKKLSGEILSEDDIPLLTELIQSHDVVVIGPGLGRDPSSLKAAAQLVPFFKKAVIDADALRPELFDALIQYKSKRIGFEDSEIIITPHYRELLRAAEFLRISLPATRKEADPDVLEEAVSEISRCLGVTVLLKGQFDLISNGIAEETRYNATGNAGMSVGGTGDVLAGIVGGLLAVNKAATAAGCGAYICGKAGDAACSEFGNSLFPSDILDKIPFIFPNKMSATCRKCESENERKNKNERKNENEKNENKNKSEKTKIKTKLKTKNKSKIKNKNKNKNKK